MPPGNPDRSAPRQAYAGLVTRMVGLLGDVFVLTIAGLAVTTLPLVAWREVIGHVPGWLPPMTSAFGSVLPWAYFTFCWWLTGRTLGGFVVGVMVRRGNGRPLGFGRAVLRAGFGLLLWPIWLLGMVGVLRDPRRRAWHDRVFGTVVPFEGRR